MKTIGIFEAKTHLSQIINEGQEVCVTHRGKEKAFIIPAPQYQSLKRLEVFRKLTELKKRVPIGTVEEILAMKNEGRK